MALAVFSLSCSHSTIFSHQHNIFFSHFFVFLSELKSSSCVFYRCLRVCSHKICAKITNCMNCLSVSALPFRTCFSFVYIAFSPLCTSWFCYARVMFFVAFLTSTLIYSFLLRFYCVDLNRIVVLGSSH